MTNVDTSAVSARPIPALDLKFLSHGTLECHDLEASRRFYEEFMGFATVRTSKISLWLRLGGNHVYVVVQMPSSKRSPMSIMNHNGIDVDSDDAVNAAHATVIRDAERWNLHDITKPMIQHGTYSFYFRDADENCWEILSNPRGGYSWMFERGDQEGLGHLKRDFDRPV